MKMKFRIQLLARVRAIAIMISPHGHAAAQILYVPRRARVHASCRRMHAQLAIAIESRAHAQLAAMSNRRKVKSKSLQIVWSSHRNELSALAVWSIILRWFDLSMHRFSWKCSWKRKVVCSRAA